MRTGTRVHAQLNLFDGPAVVLDGRRAAVPEGSLRLLAYVAVGSGRVDRRAAGGVLWPDGNDGRAAGNLRSALWRLRSAGADLVENERSTLRLRPDTSVDLWSAAAWARRVVGGAVRDGDLDSPLCAANALDLLPGWYDDWVVTERERLRQQMLHALEALSGLLLAAGRRAEAVHVALEVVGREPLRESAQRVLVTAHLAEGNVGEAVRAYLHYRQLLATELGVAPGAELRALLPARLPEGPGGPRAASRPRPAGA